jgi:hypothetical protein
MAVDLKSLSRNDQGALITGVLAVIFTFIGSYITVSVKVADVSRSAGHNAWDGWSTLGSLLLIVALALVAIRIFAPGTLPAGAPWHLITLAAAALGTVIIVIKGLTFGTPDGIPSSAVDAGVGWSGWVLFVLAIAFTVFTALLFRDSGEKIPEVNRNKNTPPAPPAA